MRFASLLDRSWNHDDRRGHCFCEVTSRVEDNPDAVRGRLHPGEFCTSCDYGVLAHYAAPTEIRRSPRQQLCLLTAGPDRPRIAQLLRKIRPFSIQQALALLDSLPTVVAVAYMDEVEAWAGELRVHGCSVELISVVERDS
jgi:hypothetical protein